MNNSTPTKTSFLGTGWAFPVRFLRNCDAASPSLDDTVATASEVQLIEQSLTILLSTRPGERVMRPDYGCALDDIMFEPANTSLLTYIKDIIAKSILYYEPRVQLRSVDILFEELIEGKVHIELDLIVRSTNSRYNYVYDFYKREATIKPI